MRESLTVCLGSSLRGLAERLKDRFTVEWVENHAELVRSPLSKEVRTILVRSDGQVSTELLDSTPLLRTVVRLGSGTDNVAIDELERRGVRLLRQPGIASDAVGEIAELALLALARKVPLGMMGLSRGQWLKAEILGNVVSEMSVAIWGSGPVGRACSTRLEGRVGSVRFAQWPSVPSDLPTAAPDELLSTADVHILALPLRESTVGFVGEPFLSRVSARRPYILNVSRFEVVDFHLVVSALGRGELRGFFTDPVDPEHVAQVREAMEGRPLNLLVTPHIGAQRADSEVAREQWVRSILESLAESQEGAHEEVSQRHLGGTFPAFPSGSSRVRPPAARVR